MRAGGSQRTNWATTLSPSRPFLVSPRILKGTKRREFSACTRERPRSFLRYPRKFTVSLLTTLRTSYLGFWFLPRFLRRSPFFFFGGKTCSSTKSPCRAVPDAPLARETASSQPSTRTLALPCRPKKRVPRTLFLPTGQVMEAWANKRDNQPSGLRIDQPSGIA